MKMLSWWLPSRTFTVRVLLNMDSCIIDQNCMLTERFKQLGVIMFYANGGAMLQNHEIVLVIIIVGKRVVELLFLSGTSDFGKVERTSVTIFGVRDSSFPTALRTSK